jgi:hypothetical protein
MFLKTDFFRFLIGLILKLLLLSGGLILSDRVLFGSSRNDLADLVQHMRPDAQVSEDGNVQGWNEDEDMGIRASFDDDAESKASFQSVPLKLGDEKVASQTGPENTDQVEETNDEIWKRVHIEEALSAELIRQCPNCLVAIVRESGCNMMVCSFCYAKMCYVCKMPVQGYSHFRCKDLSSIHVIPPQGTFLFRSQFNQDPSKCPFYTTDEELHRNNVKKAGALAKEEADRDQPNVELKHNPLEDFSDKQSSSSSSEHSDID